jgi:hypothetical protein
MALFLTSSQSSTLEPLRSNRWIMQFTTVPGAVQEANERLAFMAHSASRPNLSFESSEHHRLNERFYTAGKPEWSEISVEFYDFIQGEKSVSHILWQWANQIYNPVSGQMGFKNQYQTSSTLAMLDPQGGIVQVWNLFYIWPMEVNWNELSADSSDILNVSVTFRYDYAVKGTDVDTTPTAG